MVEVEAAQEILVGLALAAVLGDDQAGRGLEHLAGPDDRPGVQRLAGDALLARRSVGSASSARGAVTVTAGRAVEAPVMPGSAVWARAAAGGQDKGIDKSSGLVCIIDNYAYSVRRASGGFACSELLCRSTTISCNARRRMQKRRYASRSEALRDILRDVQARERLEPAVDNKEGDAFCIATLAYVYDHETRELGRRLTQAQHKHHDLQVATLHVHLDHDSCLEVAVLRGPAKAVRALADETVSQRGVRHGQLHLMPAERAPAAIHTAAGRTSTNTFMPRNNV